MLKRKQILLEDWQEEFIEKERIRRKCSFVSVIRLAISFFALSVKVRHIRSDKKAIEDMAYEARKIMEVEDAQEKESSKLIKKGSVKGHRK